MEERMRRLRKLAQLADDPEMIRCLMKMADDVEADIRKIKGDLARTGKGG
jgi:hypothetical protein